MWGLSEIDLIVLVRVFAAIEGLSGIQQNAPRGGAFCVQVGAISN